MIVVGWIVQLAGGVRQPHSCLHGEVPNEQEILRAMKARCGREGHEVLTREPEPVLIGSRWLLRAGSGAG